MQMHPKAINYRKLLFDLALVLLALGSAGAILAGAAIGLGYTQLIRFWLAALAAGLESLLVFLTAAVILYRADDRSRSR